MGRAKDSRVEYHRDWRATFGSAERLACPFRGGPSLCLPHNRTPDLVAAYRSGKTIRQIAVAFGVSWDSVRTRLVGAGVQMRKPGYTCRKPIDHAAFDAITSSSAYWIGFLMADGCVGSRRPTVTVYLAEEDGGHILKFRDFLKTGCAVQHRPGRICNGHLCRPQHGIVIQSNQIVAALAKHGVVPRKSRVARVIGLENDRDFWRGVFDGDGGIVRPQSPRSAKRNAPYVVLVGSRPLMEQFSDFCHSVLFGYRPRVSPMHSIFHVRLHGSFASAMMRVLYEGASVCLERKKVLADWLMECPWRHQHNGFAARKAGALAGQGVLF